MLPRANAAVASGTVTVRLTITGGMHYSGTWQHPERAKSDYRSVAFGGRDYSVGFNYATLNAATGSAFSSTTGKGSIKTDLFTFSVNPYRKGKTEYTNNNDVALFVGLRSRELYYNSGVPTSRLDIRIAASGSSGRLNGSGLTTYAGYSGNPIAVKATWNCSTLLRG